MNFKLAILTVLANWPERRATIDEIREEVGIIFANGGHSDSLKRLSALGDIDIFQTGLVSRNEEGFQITDAGLSLLQSLESSSGPSPEVSTAPASQPFRLINDLIGTEERLKIFELELRRLENIAFDGSENNKQQWDQDDGNHEAANEVPGSASPISIDGDPESVDSEASDVGEGDQDDPPVRGQEIPPVLIAAPYGASADVPPYLRRSFGSKGQDSGRRSLSASERSRFRRREKAAHSQRLGGLFFGKHLERKD